MAPAEHQAWWRKRTRREFLKGTAALTATGAAACGLVAAEAAKAGAAGEKGAAAPAPTSGEDLLLPPFLSRPTETSVFLTALNHRQPAEAAIELRREGAGDWRREPAVLALAPYAPLDWTLRGLAASTRYEYRILWKPGRGGVFKPVASGSFRTQRSGPASYTAVLLADSHTGSFGLDSEPVRTLDRVVQNAARAKPEFVLDLGDNVAWPGSREYAQETPDEAVEAYARYRRQLGPLSAHCPHFAVIGNWSGESGKFPAASVRMMTGVRQAFLPGPDHRTYPQGGSQREDYYAFAWGDALYLLLNIQTYSQPSEPDKLASRIEDVNRITDWTLGEKQVAWFEATLKNAKERYRFVCMHHPAGGKAGDPANTLYGRGGGRAWNTGEQTRIHALMKRHGVQIFFYGHDHVFVDDLVDGIHYTLPGSCGAPWKFTREQTGYERFWPDSGHALLDVTPEQATVSFWNLEGKRLHTFSVLPA